MTPGQEGLAAQLGERLPAQWRASYAAVPRHLFLPDVGWTLPETDTTIRSVRVDRAQDPEAWLRAAYADAAFVTQHEGARATSSSSRPLMVFEMLHALQAGPGMTALEIGTGTGWNAGLLAHRLGDANVTTVEVDAPVAEQARANLAVAGRSPLVVTGDGVFGYPEGAVYDRVEATCSVRWVPYAWVEQTRPGGIIVTPWETSSAGLIVRLRVGAGGRAVGRFVRPHGFMTLRAQYYRVPDEPDDFEDLARVSQHDGDESPSAMVSGPARTAVQLRIPDLRMTMDRDKTTGYLQLLWFLTPDSWASVDPYDGTVRQLGPRRLWDEITAAHTWWQTIGQPEPADFGLGVEPDRQWTWLTTPDQVVTELSPTWGLASV